LTPFVSVTSGRVPNIGANDGTLMLPLSGTEHGDFRPVLEHAHAARAGRARFDVGPWTEEAHWFGAKPARQPTRTTLWHTRLYPSGNLCSRREYSRLYFRVPRHRDHRPGHADGLHVDIWRGDDNVASDPGTYLYTEAHPWNNALAETRVHNTCSVGETSQMQRHGRFFWAAWNRCRLLRHNALGDGDLFLAETSADPTKSFTHTRLVLHMALGALILDRVEGPHPETLRVHWNLPATLTPDGPGILAGQDLTVMYAADPLAQTLRTVADLTQNLGWISPTYGVREPCTAFELSCMASTVHFFTLFLWQDCPDRIDKCRTLWDGWRAEGPARGAALAARLFG
jgi:hypothetical protein